MPIRKNNEYGDNRRAIGMRWTWKDKREGDQDIANDFFVIHKKQSAERVKGVRDLEQGHEMKAKSSFGARTALFRD